MNSVFVECFGKIYDPRIHRSRKHLLLDIIALTLFAVMAGAQTFNEIEDFGQIHEEWLKKYLELPNGIPSHDTINRFFCLLDPEILQKHFLDWIMKIKGYVAENVIAIDGKTMKGSHQNSKGLNALHILSAYSCSNGLSLGQMKVDGKTNEITVIPELLEQLFLEGSIVTLDAMGCQTEIADKIVEKKADYILAVKANQKELYESIVDTFNMASDKEFNHELIPEIFDHEINGDHGRIETRKVLALDSKIIETQLDLKKWANIKSIVKVVYTDVLNNNTETRYFISTLPPTDIKKIGNSIRSHWHIESLHWVLDVVFKEDDSRIRDEITAQNIAWYRKMAISLLSKDVSKMSYRRKMMRNWAKPEYIIEGLMQ